MAAGSIRERVELGRSTPSLKPAAQEQMIVLDDEQREAGLQGNLRRSLDSLCVEEGDGSTRDVAVASEEHHPRELPGTEVERGNGEREDISNTGEIPSRTQHSEGEAVEIVLSLGSSTTKGSVGGGGRMQSWIRTGSGTGGRGMAGT